VDFFSSQDQARRNTGLLVLLFVVAVVCLILLTNLAIAASLWFFEQQPATVAEGGRGLFAHMDGERFAIIGAFVCAGVALASLYKVVQLGGGGKSVAEAMGGRRLVFNTEVGAERRLLNVVEEMAIASGTAVPPVYVMDGEQGINAFAAGYAPADAVIGVTRGCMEQLSRKELQGVIAHEFSHILNGDMRLNLRLIAILNGILFIGIIGRILMRSASSRRYSSRRGNNGLPVILLGLALCAIGYIGVLFGSLIKAAVSRQREFLADASAVQFTRDPSTIADALKRIGGYPVGSRIASPQAEEISHLFFGQAIASGFMSLMATHPPLPERIRRVQPGWRGEYLASGTAGAVHDAPLVSGFTGEEVQTTYQEPAPDKALPVGDGELDYALFLLGMIPDELKQAAREPYSARAVIFALLVANDTAVAREQSRLLEDQQGLEVTQLSFDLHKHLQAFDKRARLPLIELAIPALKELSPQQYQAFNRSVVGLAKADERIGLFEWMLYRLSCFYLRPDFEKGKRSAPRIKNLQKVSEEIAVLLSAVARYGHDNECEAEAAFVSATRNLDVQGLSLMEESEIGLQRLSGSLDKLASLYPLQKPQVLKACIISIKADRQVTAVEAEFLQMVASILDCPVSPLYAGQPIEQV
jgi:Zn-dependent protease with chaperone function